MTTVILMRHGETAWNHESRLQGWAPVSLNDRGREQAAAAGEYLDRDDATLAAPDRVIASDLVRTRETATAVQSELDTSVRFDSAWRERDLGVYQGLPLTTVTERFPSFGLGEDAADAADQVPDSGESLTQVADRVVSSWEELIAASDPDESVLVVTHGGPIRLLLGHIEDLSIAEAMLTDGPKNCSLTEIECENGTAEIVHSVTPWAPDE